MLEVFNEFHSRLSQFGSVVIAGGAVRDFLMERKPKDVDVFVLSDAKFPEVRDGIIQAVDDLERVDPVVDWHQSEPFLATSVRWNDNEVQVLINPAPSLDDLIATFDWNVCLFGYDGQVTQKEDVSNIKAGADLWLQKVTYPKATLRRGFRFSERFKMKIKDDELKNLCRLVAGGEKRNENN